MTQGVLMFAHNNDEIDYFKIAYANALMVKKNLGVPVSIITDSGSLGWAKTSIGETNLAECFDHIITVDRDYTFKNPRTFSDTSFSTKSLQFYNCNHWAAYELTPYDETLLIDSDYLIMSSALNNCWGTDNDVLIDHRIYSPGGDRAPYTKYIDDFGIKLYWATVIYFKKSKFSEVLFYLVKHIQDNYRYYKDLYCFANSMYRNDNAFSVAVHTLNGFVDTDNSTIGKLPVPGLLMSWDVDDIHSVPGVDDIMVYTEKPEKGQYLLSRFKNTDIHIMNKWAINRFSDRLIELYKE